MSSLIGQQQTTVNESLTKLKRVLKNYSEIDAGFSGVSADINSKITDLIDQIKSKIFTISIVATTKAGKSTFINALIGDQYLPSSNVAETATILYVRHSQKTYLETVDAEIQNRSEILEAIKKRNQLFREKGFDPKKKFVLHVPYQKFSENEIQFQFVDTPGPNEAGIVSVGLKKEIEKVLTHSDVVIYLLDYTKLKTKDEADLFETIKSIRKDLFKDIQSRLFFVVNKIDRRNQNSLDPEATIKHVNALLHEQIGVDSKKIYCIAAERALLAKMLEAGNHSRLDDFGKLQFGESWEDSVNATQEEKIQRLKPGIKQNIDKSSLPVLEKEIIDFIITNSDSLFSQSILEKTGKIIDEAENGFNLQDALVTKSKLELQSLLNDLKKKIQSINSEMKEVDTIVESFSKEMQKDIESKFNDFGEDISKVVERIINHKPEKKEIDYVSLENLADSAVESSADLFGGDKAPRIKKIYTLGKAALKTIWSNLQSCDNLDETDAKSKIETINQQISKLIEIGFSTVREEIEIRVSEKLHEVNYKLEKIVNRSNAELFEEVNLKLNFSDALKLVEISLPKESSLKISAGYDEFVEKHYSKKPGGLCRGSYQSLDYVTLNKKTLVGSWKKEITNQKKISLRVVQEYIQQEIFQKTESVKEEFNRNAKAFVNQINNNQKNSTDSQFVVEKKRVALENARQELRQIKKILDS